MARSASRRKTEGGGHRDYYCCFGPSRRPEAALGQDNHLRFPARPRHVRRCRSRAARARGRCPSQHRRTHLPHQCGPLHLRHRDARAVIEHPQLHRLEAANRPRLYLHSRHADDHHRQHARRRCCRLAGRLRRRHLRRHRLLRHQQLLQQDVALLSAGRHGLGHHGHRPLVDAGRRQLDCRCEPRGTRLLRADPHPHGGPRARHHPRHLPRLPRLPAPDLGPPWPRHRHADCRRARHGGLPCGGGGSGARHHDAVCLRLSGL